MIYAFITERCSDLPTSTCCRVMKVSTSGFYQRRNQPLTDRELDDAYAANEVHDIWTMSRHSYGSPRVHKEADAEGTTLASVWPTELGGGDIEVGKPQRGQRLTTDDLVAVAEVYAAAWRNGEPVTEAVRKAFYLSRDGTAKRFMKARKAGLLEGMGPQR